jgi:hypothetical protein
MLFIVMFQRELCSLTSVNRIDFRETLFPIRYKIAPCSVTVVRVK